MIIREMRGDDVPACVNITFDNWGMNIANRFEDEVRHAWLHGLSDPPVYCVAEEDGLIIGYAGIKSSWIMHGVWDFIWINVSKKHQNKGVGKVLTQSRIDDVKKKGGSVICLMTREWPFFERFGFRIGRVIDGWAHMTLRLKELNIYDE